MFYRPDQCWRGLFCSATLLFAQPTSGIIPSMLLSNLYSSCLAVDCERVDRLADDRFDRLRFCYSASKYNAPCCGSGFVRNTEHRFRNSSR